MTSSLFTNALCAQSLLSIRARKKTVASKAIYATQGVIALVCAAGVAKEIGASKALKAITYAALGAITIAALNKLEDNNGGQ
ncbi:MAG: hypothetical protein LBP89_05625 [Helicobacteraceae bacterium]|jgi:hypothetical protein|nr:hypothetical protein [Helicobacteraceae bacterium]